MCFWMNLAISASELFPMIGAPSIQRKVCCKKVILNSKLRNSKYSFLEDKLQSEEIKFVGIHTIFYLLQSSTDQIFEELFSSTNKPLLGHLFFTLLKVSTYEEMKELRYYEILLFSL